MDFQPLERRRSPHEALEITPGMQPLPAPVGGGEERDRDPRPVRRPRLVELVIQRVFADLLAERHPRRRQFHAGEGLRPGDSLARGPAAGAVLADTVLYHGDLLVVPVRPERGEDAAVMRGVTVEIRGALPHAHSGQVRWLQAGHVPLVHRVIRDAIQPDLARAPRLPGCPLDAFIQVAGLPRRVWVEQARGAPRAAGVHPHAGVAIGDPLLRVNDLPVLVLVARATRHIRVLPGHELPLIGIPVLEGQPLGVWAVGQDHRMAPGPGRAEDVRAQHDAVVHGHRDIPPDQHVSACRRCRAGLAGSAGLQCHSVLPGRAGRSHGPVA